jgi:NTP pyrophosphatase (non-canonical NTP hydrolase)
MTKSMMELFDDNPNVVSYQQICDVNNLPGEVKDEIASELGDCLWYISALATDLGIGLDGVVVENIRKLQKRKEKGTIHGSGDKR